MGAQLRILRSRIRSISSTAKITRAQELIAASHIGRAQERLARAKPYAREMTGAVSALLSHHVHLDHPLLAETSGAGRSAILLITSDRGFCGAFNQGVLKQGDALARLIREQGGEPAFYLSGNKAAEHFAFRGREAEDVWTGFSGQPPYTAAAEIGRRLTDAYVTGTGEGGVGEVHVVYTEFVSMLHQRLTVRRILPLEIEEVHADEPGVRIPPAYEFEPTPAAVLDGLLGQYVRARIWHMLLESAAAEWAARRQAMMAATDNAGDLIADLSRRANEARQEEITNELNEIVSGANALRETHGS